MDAHRQRYDHQGRRGAGQGVESSGAGFAKALARAGTWIYGLQDYMSRIRGGHNFYQIRTSDHEVWSFRDQVHMLLPFTAEAVERHWRRSCPGGAVLYDVGVKFDEAPLRERDVKLFALPLMKIAEEQGGSRVMMNTAALGAVAGLTEFGFEHIADIIETNFKRKGGAVVEANLKVARYAYDLGLDQFASQYDWKLVGAAWVRSGWSSTATRRLVWGPSRAAVVYSRLPDDPCHDDPGILDQQSGPVRHRHQADRGRDRRYPDRHRRCPCRACGR